MKRGLSAYDPESIHILMLKFYIPDKYLLYFKKDIDVHSYLLMVSCLSFSEGEWRGLLVHLEAVFLALLNRLL